MLIIISKILIGGRDKNGGSIIVIQGTEGQTYWVASMAKILSYLGKIPEYVISLIALYYNMI